jgi:hypothetical protein
MNNSHFSEPHRKRFSWLKAALACLVTLGLVTCAFPPIPTLSAPTSDLVGLKKSAPTAAQAPTLQQAATLLPAAKTAPTAVQPGAALPAAEPVLPQVQWGQHPAVKTSR